MRILIFTLIPAPYRVEVFRRLAETHNITVVFEQDYEYGREKLWFSYNLGACKYLVLNDTGRKETYSSIVHSVEKHEYDAVILYEYSTRKSIKLMNTCILHCVPYAINGDGAFMKKCPIKDIIKRFYISHASLLFASGNIVKEYFEHYGAKKEKIFCHPFTSLGECDMLETVPDDELRKKIREQFGIVGKKVAITASRFIAGKHNEDLIKVWTQFPEDWILILLGSGEMRTQYEVIVSQNKMSNVIMPGYVDKQKLLEYMIAGDVLVFPTERDVWGLVVNEAMSRALPVITTDQCIAGRELVKDQYNGYIYHSGDCDAMKEIIAKVLNDDNGRRSMAEHAFESIKHYTYENIVKAHLEALEYLHGDVK